MDSDMYFFFSTTCELDLHRCKEARKIPRQTRKPRQTKNKKEGHPIKQRWGRH